MDLAEAGANAYRFQQVCFVAGSPLLETELSSKPIEEFKSYEEFGDGCDYILTRDENNPEAALERRRVLRKFVRSAPVLNLHVGGRIIETTAEHPFHVEGKGWIPAGLLEAGDVLLSHDGLRLPVEEVADSGRVTTVYNLEVEGCHTYFVGCQEWGFSVWAHNASKYQSEGPENARRRPKFRKETQEAALKGASTRTNAAGEMVKVCPLCGKEIGGTIQRGSRNIRDYQIDHTGKTWAERVAEMPVDVKRADVVTEYQREVRVICHECNENHQHEGK